MIQTKTERDTKTETDRERERDLSVSLISHYYTIISNAKTILTAAF